MACFPEKYQGDAGHQRVSISKYMCKYMPSDLFLFIFPEDNNRARCQWLMPVILATQETEIRRVTLQSQTWANNSIRPYLENT
jgi:hypothetical protein